MTGGQVHSQITLAVHVRYVLGEETHWVTPAVGKLRRNTHLSDEAGRWEPTMQTNEAAAYHEGSVLQGFGGGGATVVVELTQRQGVFTAVPQSVVQIHSSRIQNVGVRSVALGF